MKACPICNFYSLPFLEGLLYLGLCPLRIPYSDLPFKMVLPRAHLQCGGPGFSPWVRKIPWRRKWQPTPVFLPGEFHGQRSLVGYSPWGRKESDTTERLHFHFRFSLCIIGSSFIHLIRTDSNVFFLMAE